MNTAFLLMALYGGTVAPIGDVCRDYFKHLGPREVVRKATEPKIDLPGVVTGQSQKSRAEAAGEECDQLRGRKWMRHEPTLELNAGSDLIPTIFANGEDDDAPGLIACFSNKPVMYERSVYMPGDRVKVLGKILRISKGLYVLGPGYEPTLDIKKGPWVVIRQPQPCRRVVIVCDVSLQVSCTIRGGP